ncbi:MULTISPECIES: ParB N-terminal domain-containing protein [unclassified Enterococcus]|uniref:ParB N-terminal domain-containing protein n=1 Tax=unclassified Enterococcus TaxID=2608891 RepID=UPI0013EAEA29|nr:MULTISPECIES: ParB N-terminal domain-containing protein [unclassified Enterococcus]
MDSIFRDIYLASEYDQFKLIKGNRKVTANMRLEASIKEKGVLRPIVVNSNMEILDRQHRYTIAKKHSIPLPYYVSTSKSMEDIIDLNNATNRWKLEDYIHKYKEDGLVHYIWIDQLIQNHKYISLTDMCTAAEGYLKKSHNSLEKVKTGKFKFINYEGFIVCLNDFKEFIYKTQIRSTTGVFAAFFCIYTVKKFNLQNFIERTNLEDTKNKIIGIRDEKRILKMFVETYNRKLKTNYKNYIEYHVNKDRSIDILEERKEELLAS